MAEGGSKRINVVVKTPKDKKTVEVDEDSGIKDVSTEHVTRLTWLLVPQTLLDPSIHSDGPPPSLPALCPHPRKYWEISARNRGTVHFA